MAKENGKKKLESPVRIEYLRSLFALHSWHLLQEPKTFENSIYVVHNMQALSLSLSPSLFYSSSLVFSCWICLFSFVVDFDFYGCQRALKVAKRVTLHSIPLRLWRVFNSPVNRLQSRVANWNSAWGGDEKGQEEACFEAPFWWLLKVEKGKNKCCQCCWAGIINK